MEDLLERLLTQFPESHWALWNQEFGHNFFELHGPRTVWYDEILGDTIAGARVLEVGGFPGLLASWLLHRGCEVETIEHPAWVPEWYMKWRAEKYPCTLHDITTGPPEHIPTVARWDWAIISDVLLHLDGFPSAFLEWLVPRVDNIMLCQYPGKVPNTLPCVGGSLKKVYPTPRWGALVVSMAAMGAEVVETWTGHSRELFHFTGGGRDADA